MIQNNVKLCNALIIEYEYVNLKFNMKRYKVQCYKCLCVASVLMSLVATWCA